MTPQRMIPPTWPSGRMERENYTPADQQFWAGLTRATARRFPDLVVIGQVFDGGLQFGISAETAGGDEGAAMRWAISARPAEGDIAQTVERAVAEGKLP